MEINNKVSSKEMLDLISKHPGFKLFHDEKQKPWVRLKDCGALKIFSCDSSSFSSWCCGLIHNEFKIIPPNETLKNVIGLLKAQAIWESSQYVLHNRIAHYGKQIAYDLSNDTWDKVFIDINGWKIIEKEKEPILFKRYNHHKPQVTPAKGIDCKYVEKLLDYVNITDEDQKILFVVWIISCFIPDFPHPLVYIYGPQGSAKSTISKIVREIIDPSILEVGTLPKNHENLVQQLDHHWLNFFDNVSYIDQHMSDLLCKAITGIGISKRELYTNDEDIIYNFKRCIGINGINLEGAQPDLLERSILFNLKRMNDFERKPEDELKKEFEKDKPKIMGAIFSTLSQALKIKEDVELERTPRMADFAIWGCAIAEALGYEQDYFLDAYLRNIDGQTEEGINSNPVAITIREFMADKPIWEGTPRELYNLLSGLLFFEGHSGFVDFPKNEVVLSKKIGQVEVILGKIGIVFERERGERRIIRLINQKFKTQQTIPIADSVDSNDSKNPDIYLT